MIAHTSKHGSTKLAQRFWSLLVGIMFAAIATSALAIWFTANPFLKDFQENSILQKAQERARSLETILDQHRQLLAFVASQRDVIAVSMGYVENAEILKDYLTDAKLPDQLSWVALYDAFAEPLAMQSIHGGEVSGFAPSEIEALVLEVAEGEAGAQEVVLSQQVDDTVQLLIAAPVINKGFIEGVLVGDLVLDVNQVFPPSEGIVSTAILSADAQRAPGGQDLKSITQSDVSGTSLIVSIEPDSAVTTKAGQTLLINTAGAISLVLALAFGTFAWLGRTSIIAPHRKLEQQKRDLSELAAVARMANDAIIVTDLEEKVLWCNPAFHRLSGFSIDNVRGKRPRDFLQGPETTAESRMEIRRSISDGSPKKTEILNYSASGRPYWISISITPLRDEADEIYGYMAISSDVTEARRQREELIKSKNEIEFQSMHDPLTGLANRRAFDTTIEARRAHNITDGTIIRIDLDHFKYVNDNMGHAAGDYVLCEVANILKAEIRTTPSDRLPDLAARMGGDEFVILLSPSTTFAQAVYVSERLLEKIKRPMSFESHTIEVGASFGIASTEGGLLAADDLLAAADAALYDAKESGRNTVCSYTSSLHREVVERRKLAREFRSAISNQEFEPYFQPQFDAATGELSGVEVLARWPSKRRGLLTPDAFLPVARQLSLMQELDHILFQKASDQIMTLHAKGIIIPKISFNVTAERLISGEIFRSIQSLKSDRPQVAVEVLESVIVEEQSDSFRFQIERLREFGVLIEIDDFGSGHTSVVGIMDLNPDVMKIDRRLILPITQSKQARNMLEQIVGMARIMGLKVTAEGIETDAHAEIAKKAGCDTLQGFALACPIPINELETLATKLNREKATKSG